MYIERCYGMKINVENIKVTIPISDYDISETMGECVIFQTCW
jgi:hypothetical protein